MNLLAWIGPWLWWSLLTVGFAASLIGMLAWYFREVSQGRLPAPRFFLIALLVHGVLAAGSFYVYLDNGAARKSGEGCSRSWLPPACRCTSCANRCVRKMTASARSQT